MSGAENGPSGKIPRPSDAYQVGDRVPLPDRPRPKLYPAYNVGEAKKSLRGAFTNGRGTK